MLLKYLCKRFGQYKIKATITFDELQKLNFCFSPASSLLYLFNDHTNQGKTFSFLSPFSYKPQRDFKKKIITLGILLYALITSFSRAFTDIYYLKSKYSKSVIDCSVEFFLLVNRGFSGISVNSECRFFRAKMPPKSCFLHF